MVTGRKGKGWTQSLNAARKAGAVIVVEETGQPVTYDPLPGSRKPFRPWRVYRGKRRYDSVECIPDFT